jgi:hypothetical protein
MHQFPWMSPYVGFDNNPIYFIDPYGLSSTNGDGDPPKPTEADQKNGTWVNPETGSTYFYDENGNWGLTLPDEVVVTASSIAPTIIRKEYGSYNYSNVEADNLTRQKYLTPLNLPERSTLEADLENVRRNQPVMGQKLTDNAKLNMETGKIYAPVFSVIIPGRDLLNDVINGQTITASAVIIGGIEFVPFGKLFVKGGKIFAKITRGGKEVVEDVTNATIKMACFVEGTPIAVEGGLVAIEDIKVGDKVWAFDEETGAIELKTVYNTVVKEIDHLIKLIVGEDTIYTTDNHPFWVFDTWKKAGNLKVGDTLTLRNGAHQILTYKERIDTSIIVYNFAVEDFHTYFVGEQEILVHNDNPCATAITKKTATEIAKNCKKMTEDQITQLLGKDWHKNGSKSRLVKKFSRELKGSTNADFYVDKTTFEVLLQGNKTKSWVQTGLFLE